MHTSIDRPHESCNSARPGQKGSWATEAMRPTGLGWLDAAAHSSVRARAPIQADSYSANGMTAYVH